MSCSSLRDLRQCFRAVRVPAAHPHVCEQTAQLVGSPPSSWLRPQEQPHIAKILTSLLLCWSEVLLTALLGTASTAGTALMEENCPSLCNICIYHQVLAAGRLSEIPCLNVS